MKNDFFTIWKAILAIAVVILLIWIEWTEQYVPVWIELVLLGGSLVLAFDVARNK